MSTSLLQKPPKRRCRRRDPFKIVSFDVEGSSSSAKNDQVILPVKTVEQPLRPRQIKSRSGCEPCKRRHVKCDETQPICLRCQKSDITCTGIFKLDPWQIERPWLDSTHERVQTLEALVLGAEPQEVVSPKGARLTKTLENELLRHWFDKACTFMGIVPQSSHPLSYAISPYIQQSRALRHSIQCISQAHLGHFSEKELACVLDERSRALASLRLEIDKTFTGKDSGKLRQRCLQTTVLSSLMLGITSGWVDKEMSGLQFLTGARNIVPLLLDTGQLQDPISQYVLGLYLYWEGVSSHIEPGEPLITVDSQYLHHQHRLGHLSFLQSIADNILGSYIHPVTGLAAGVFPLMGAAGRYYRNIVEGCPEDPAYVEYLESELDKWIPIPVLDFSEDNQKLLHLAEAYRSVAVLLLCQARSASQMGGHNLIRDERAQNAVANVMHILQMVSPGDPLLTSVGPFFLIAGSELREDEIEARDLVRQVALEVTKYTRVTAFTSAFELVQDVWAQRKRGLHVTWLEVMLQNGRCVSIA